MKIKIEPSSSPSMGIADMPGGTLFHYGDAIYMKISLLEYYTVKHTEFVPTRNVAINIATGHLKTWVYDANPAMKLFSGKITLEQ